MKIKCGRNEIELTEKDEIMYNGKCFIILTQKVFTSNDIVNPEIALGKGRKMIKDGLLELKRKEKRILEVEIYKVKESM